MDPNKQIPINIIGSNPQIHTMQGRSFTHFDLVVVSPLTRTLETARHIFKRGRMPGQPTFMDDKCRRTDSLTGQEFSLPAPRMLVREECRERWGEYVCDGRRSITEIYPEFPDFDFSEVANDDDVFYGAERESDEHCCKRAQGFLEWLNRRPEKALTPALASMASSSNGLFTLGKLDADSETAIARTLGVTGYPTLFGVKEGRVVNRMVGMPKGEEEMRAFLAKFVGGGETEEGMEEVGDKLMRAASGGAFGFGERERTTELVRKVLGGVREDKGGIEAVGIAARLLENVAG
ncbi:hypothetical protein TrRE_jg7806, partial [Triparma retinervis]